MLEVVAKVTEIDAQSIISTSRVAEVVDARHILVRMLYEKGLPQSRISRCSNFSKSAISQMLSKFDDRMRYGGFAFKDAVRRCRLLING